MHAFMAFMGLLANDQHLFWLRLFDWNAGDAYCAMQWVDIR